MDIRSIVYECVTDLESGEHFYGSGKEGKAVEGRGKKWDGGVGH